MEDKERVKQAARKGELRRAEERMDWEQAEWYYCSSPGLVTAIAAALLLGCLALSCV